MIRHRYRRERQVGGRGGDRYWTRDKRTQRPLDVLPINLLEDTAVFDICNLTNVQIERHRIRVYARALFISNVILFNARRGVKLIHFAPLIIYSSYI